MNWMWSGWGRILRIHRLKWYPDGKTQKSGCA